MPHLSKSVVLNQNHRSIMSPGKIRGKLTRMTGSKTSSVSYGGMTSNHQWS